ncbi:unnamed protein product [Lymnaea stagnalis]|uniref:Uncharacterized protein n=1 Tax=Lymnaea stagnalis TaxID=6523 RepID=A0AAV2I0S3_LYMST
MSWQTKVIALGRRPALNGTTTSSTSFCQNMKICVASPTLVHRGLHHKVYHPAPKSLSRRNPLPCHVLFTSAAPLRHISSGVIDKMTDVADLMIQEPSLGSLGIGHFWTPWGLAQQYIGLLHTGMGLPWWASIVTSPILIRACLFPLLWQAQKDYHRFETEAKRLTPDIEYERFYYVLKENAAPRKLFVANGAALILMLFAINGMATCPVPSFTHGGLLWFKDLTSADYVFGLPLVTALATLQAKPISRFFGKPKFINHQTFGSIFTAVLFAFVTKMPSAVLLYWLSHNCISIMQNELMKNARAREFLKLPPNPGAQ